MRDVLKDIEAMLEGAPSKNRKSIAGDPGRVSRAGADIFHATDVTIRVNLGVADLRKLLAGKDLEIDAKDVKKRDNESNVYRVVLRYGGRGVPEF